MNRQILKEIMVGKETKYCCLDFAAAVDLGIIIELEGKGERESTMNGARLTECPYCPSQLT